MRKQFKREDTRTRGEKIQDAVIFLFTMGLANALFYHLLNEFTK